MPSCGPPAAPPEAQIVTCASAPPLPVVEKTRRTAFGKLRLPRALTSHTGQAKNRSDNDKGENNENNENDEDDEDEEDDDDDDDDDDDEDDDDDDACDVDDDDADTTTEFKTPLSC